MRDGPASESLQGRNPRGAWRGVRIYGDLTGLVWWARGVGRRPRRWYCDLRAHDWRLAWQSGQWRGARRFNFAMPDGLRLQIELEGAQPLGCRLVWPPAVRWRREMVAPVMADRSWPFGASAVGPAAGPLVYIGARRSR